MTKSQIMRRAWALYRATVAEYPETRSRAQFALCLKIAHADAATARAARRDWKTMNGEQQNTALLRMAWTVKRRAEALGRSADTAWIVTPDDAQTVAAEAWPRVAPALDRNDAAEQPRPLAPILFAACSQAANAIARAERRHTSTCCQIVPIDADGSAADQTPLDILPSVTAAPLGSPEQSALLRAAIDASAKDDTDLRIMQAPAEGLSVRQIAAALNMSKSAIQRRIDAFRARYRAAM